MNKSDRSFTLKLVNKELRSGKISVRLLTKTLSSLQKTVYSLGNSRIKREVVTQGRHPSIVERACELFLLKAESGSLTTTLAFQPKVDDLAVELPDLADNVLKDLKEVFSSMKNRDKNKLVNTVQDPHWRKKIISDLKQTLPVDKDDYELLVKFDDTNTFQAFHRPSNAEMVIFIDDIEAEVLPEINAEEETEIRAHCRAKIKDDGEPNIIKVIDYEIIYDTRPYRADEIIWGSEKFMFRNEVACSVRIEEKYYIIEYEPLDILACAKTRAEAIEQFKEEISMLWHAYVLEDDDNLTGDAIELKRKVERLIEGVQIIGNFQNERDKKRVKE